MSSRSRIHSTSSVSHSDIGSDKDEYTGPHSYSHKRRSSPSPTDLRTPTTVETADVSTAMKLNTTTTITTTTTTTTHQTTSSRSDSVRNTVTKAQIAPEASTGPYLFVFDWAVSLYYPIRAMILFVLGFVFSLVIDHLQTQHQLVQYHPDTNNRFSNSGSSNNNVYFMSSTRMLFDTASWLPPTCGASAVLIGTIYPLGDYLWWGKRVQRNGRDWSGVMRCLGGFIGVNYAASKLPWTSSLQVSCTLALISAGLWFLFDRTFHGFVISLTVATMGTIVAYFLVLNGWYSFTRADFFGVGPWIPCILYSSSVCFGSIGRQLDVVPEAWYQSNHCSRVHLKSE
ncbi:insulin-induced protein-domain-containing protein [Lobosporangium transversale]|uniref:Insulin-induced protein-domain-containing protein n=1 Tax=Lobosporangium transversale TaxID=64571 RepID=A0A1Y2GEH3_9FUNG|nr:insulin-induced protein-domain-containing protein [Lobosporangium transversale]ORZ07226.1 insulin-induced protein-domain-containing protein [Lobosporangium transversale]|eukprot:XP_021877889.1 insulin-induced protein-domain-containing protein [Lobosporangium transversale]